MNSEKEIKLVQALEKSFGKTVISVDNAVENLHFIRKSKELAKTHDWLYIVQLLLR